jgi:hypothetical protein
MGSLDLFLHGGGEAHSSSIIHTDHFLVLNRAHIFSSFSVHLDNSLPPGAPALLPAGIHRAFCAVFDSQITSPKLQVVLEVEKATLFRRLLPGTSSLSCRAPLHFHRQSLGLVRVAAAHAYSPRHRGFPHMLCTCTAAAPRIS